jgi:hypothetical protein
MEAVGGKTSGETAICHELNVRVFIHNAAPHSAFINHHVKNISSLVNNKNLTDLFTRRFTKSRDGGRERTKETITSSFSLVMC